MLSVCMAAVLCFSFCQPVFAMTESEIQDQVNAMGKEAASGNVLIWFLCAIAFLKVSQKIDSFMSSLGINVGHTGGSMLAEAMIAARGIGGLKNFSSQHFGGGHSRVSSHTNAGSKGFMSGGLAGIVGSRITNSAVKSATASSETSVSRPSGKSGGGLGSHIYASSVSSSSLAVSSSSFMPRDAFSKMVLSGHTTWGRTALASSRVGQWITWGTPASRAPWAM